MDGLGCTSQQQLPTFLELETMQGVYGGVGELSLSCITVPVYIRSKKLPWLFLSFLYMNTYFS